MKTQTKLKKPDRVYKKIVQIFRTITQSNSTKKTFDTAVIQLSTIDFRGKEQLKTFTINQLRRLAKVADHQKKFTKF